MNYTVFVEWKKRDRNNRIVKGHFKVVADNETSARLQVSDDLTKNYEPGWWIIEVKRG